MLEEMEEQDAKEEKERILNSNEVNTININILPLSTTFQSTISHELRMCYFHSKFCMAIIITIIIVTVHSNN